MIVHAYEKMIADDINQVANKEIYFKPDEIMREPDSIATGIIGKFVSWACRPTNIMPISIARNCLKQFPADWVSEKIKQTVFNSIDINDYWDYRRLLEITEIISADLLKWAITLGEKSDDFDIIEAVSDFKERIQTYYSSN